MEIDCYGTMGPACQSEDMIYKLFAEGMTGMRLNLSHSNLKDCKQWIDNFHHAAARRGITPKLLIDLQGPELRTGSLKEPILLSEGELIYLGADQIPVEKLVLQSLKKGMDILLDDGYIELEVVESQTDQAKCLVKRGGFLKSRKSIAVKQANLHPPTLTESDRKNLKAAKSYGVTGVMLPFVRDVSDLINLKEELQNVHASELHIFAKIENMEGVHILNELLPYADHIVIARGDLGNDMPLWELPMIQKTIANQCIKANKPFMVVTQMLHSMQENPVPTRAEVSDIYNAVVDKAASVMLTGETAVGKYPVEAMRYLCQTVQTAIKYNFGDLSTCKK